MGNDVQIIIVLGGNVYLDKFNYTYSHLDGPMYIVVVNYTCTLYNIHKHITYYKLGR